MPKNISLATVLFSALLLSGAGEAAAADPTPLPGWVHQAADGRMREGAAWNGSTAVYSSPVIADIDGNPANGKEVAIGGADGKLSVFRSNGQLLWTINMPVGNCGVAAIMSSPAVATLFPNTPPSVIVGYGSARRDCDGGVATYDGPTGAMHWNFSTLAFSQQLRFREMLHTVFSTPAVADVDGDGVYEIGFGSFDRHVYLLNADGSLRWSYQAADTVWSSPAFANADANPDLEMIIGTDISANKRIKPATQNGGYIYALRTRPRAKKMVAFRDPTLVLWKTPVDQVVYSSPVIANVFPGDGVPEVIVGSGCYFPTATAAKGGRWIKILALRTGQVLQTLLTPTCSPSSVAAGDLDGDGVPEIVATVSGDPSIGGDGFGRIMAFKSASPYPIWETVANTHGYNDRWLGQISSPILADLDSNGSVEVVVSNGNGLEVLQGANGLPLTCATADCSNSSINLMGSPSRSTPAVADLNGDGKLDLVSAGRSESGGGAIYGWTNFEGTLKSAPGNLPKGSLPFPMYRGNAFRNGVAAE